MPLNEPSWWYGQDKQFVARLLTPLGALYGRTVKQRFATTTPNVAELPVICIGNFTAGGTGKTPTALLVAKILREMGETPAFLSRGYGGNLKGPHWVNRANDAASAVGDEPLLLARHASTLISRDRGKGAMAIAAGLPATETPRPHPTVIIMDDGLQNPILAKDLTISVVDGKRGFGNACVFPAGPLRAPLSFQLPLADAILINNRGPGGAAREAGDIDCVAAGGTVADNLKRSFAGPILAAETRPAGDTSWLLGERVVAFAGIGAPERFFEMLRHLGADIIAVRSFSDHHAYSDGDAAILLDLARDCAARLVTTEKDLARLLPGGLGRLSDLQSSARAVAIELHLETDAAAQLRQLLAAALARGSDGQPKSRLTP